MELTSEFMWIYIVLEAIIIIWNAFDIRRLEKRIKNLEENIIVNKKLRVFELHNEKYYEVFNILSLTPIDIIEKR